MGKSILTLLLVSLGVGAQDLPLSDLSLPPGFSISVFAQVENARQMTRSETGVIYVGSRRAGNLYAVVDSNGDFVADAVHKIDGTGQCVNAVHKYAERIEEKRVILLDQR